MAGMRSRKFWRASVYVYPNLYLPYADKFTVPVSTLIFPAFLEEFKIHVTQLIQPSLFLRIHAPEQIIASNNLTSSSRSKCPGLHDLYFSFCFRMQKGGGLLALRGPWAVHSATHIVIQSKLKGGLL